MNISPRNLLCTVAGTACLLMSACVSVNDLPPRGEATSPALSPPDNSILGLLRDSPETERLKAARAEGVPINHPRRAKDFERLQKEINKSTQAVAYSDNRVKIFSKGSFLGSNDKSELDFFIRSAAETLDAGYDGFVVVHLDYFSSGPRLFPLAPNTNFSSSNWIGTYEDFLNHRNEQNMFESKSGMNRKVRQGVILMVKDDQFPNRDRFDASQMYFNLIEARYGL